MKLLSKRLFLAGAAAMTGGISWARSGKGWENGTGEWFEVMRTPEQWRASLTPAQYSVLRESGTERPGSSRLNIEKRSGLYACAGCDLPLFDSTAKFDSGTGWPSFTAPLGNAVRTRPDRGLLGVRTEAHCRRCGGHLGHVFTDGPAPTGQRWCMNGVAMIFFPGRHA